MTEEKRKIEVKEIWTGSYNHIICNISKVYIFILMITQYNLQNSCIKFKNLSLTLSIT